MPVLFVDPAIANCIATAQATARSRVVLLPDRRAEQDEDRIADELVDRALILLDHRDHGRQVAIEQRHDALRRAGAPTAR